MVVGEGQRVLELRQIVLAHTEGQEPGSGNWVPPATLRLRGRKTQLCTERNTDFLEAP